MAMMITIIVVIVVVIIIRIVTRHIGWWTGTIHDTSSSSSIQTSQQIIQIGGRIQ